MKILEISKKPCKYMYDSFGGSFLYPNKTIRKVKKLTFKGYKILYEVSSIEQRCTFDSVIYFNEWKEIIPSFKNNKTKLKHIKEYKIK